MMPDLTSDPQASASHAPAHARSALCIATNHLPGRSHFRRFRLRHHAWVFGLRAVAPHGGLLLSHQRDVAGRGDGLAGSRGRASSKGDGNGG